MRIHSIDDAISNGITTVYTKDYYKTLRLFRDHSDEFKTETKPMLKTKAVMTRKTSRASWKI
ncbi:MAG: hypothetical protein ACLTK0_07390 [Anaerovoracaceae bacterium]